MSYFFSMPIVFVGLLVLVAGIFAYAFFLLRKDDNQKIYLEAQSNLAAQKDMINKLKIELSELKEMNKKIEWLEIKMNARHEVQKFALPQELRIVVERKKALKKAIEDNPLPTTRRS